MGEQSQVEMTVDHLSGAVEELSTLLRAYSEQLSPILLPSVPKQKEDQVVATDQLVLVATDQLVPLACDIMKITSKVEALTALVDDLRRRTEIGKGKG